MGNDDLRREQREARLEAAPFAAAILAANVALALASRAEGWELFGAHDWWLWLVFASPSAVLVATFAVGVRRIGLDRVRRELALVLLGVLVGGTITATGCVVISLMTSEPTGPQLLASAGVVLFTNVVAFGLVFWELDAGGPVARAVGGPRTRRPDFRFPQDETPELAREDWSPALVDYVYVAVTNSIAFSPTDTMPLSHRAKLFMALESSISALTVLLVAARAISLLR